LWKEQPFDFWGTRRFSASEKAKQIEEHSEVFLLLSGQQTRAESSMPRDVTNRLHGGAAWLCTHMQGPLLQTLHGSSLVWGLQLLFTCVERAVEPGE